MGMRKYKRQIARTFMQDVGVGNVNRKRSKARGGVKLWRLALQEHAKICRTVNARKVSKNKRTIRKAAQA